MISIIKYQKSEKCLLQCSKAWGEVFNCLFCQTSETILPLPSLQLKKSTAENLEQGNVLSLWLKKLLICLFQHFTEATGYNAVVRFLWLHNNISYSVHLDILCIILYTFPPLIFPIFISKWCSVDLESLSYTCICKDGWWPSELKKLDILRRWKESVWIGELYDKDPVTLLSLHPHYHCMMILDLLTTFILLLNMSYYIHITYTSIYFRDMICCL